MTQPGGYDSNGYQQSPAGGQQGGGYDPAGGYPPSEGYQAAAAPAAAPAATVGYDPAPDTVSVMARTPFDEPRYSTGGVLKTIVLILIITGLILMLGARIHIASLITMEIDYYDDEDQKKGDDIKYMSTILNSLAMALIPMGLIIGAVMIEDLGPPVRSGLAIAAGIVIGLTAFTSIIG